MRFFAALRMTRVAALRMTRAYQNHKGGCILNDRAALKDKSGCTLDDRGTHNGRRALFRMAEEQNEWQRGFAQNGWGSEWKR